MLRGLRGGEQPFSSSFLGFLSPRPKERNCPQPWDDLWNILCSGTFPPSPSNRCCFRYYSWICPLIPIIYRLHTRRQLSFQGYGSCEPVPHCNNRIAECGRLAGLWLCWIRCQGLPCMSGGLYRRCQKAKGGSQLLIKKPMAKINRCLLPDN